MATIDVEAHFSPDAWVEIQLLDDATKFNATVDIDSFEEAGFEREIEYRNFFHNAKVAIKKTQNDGTLTMNARLRRADWLKMLHGTGTVETDGTGSITSGGNQEDYRIIFLVTEDPAVTTASDAVGSYDAYRAIYAGCKATEFTVTLEADGMIEGQIMFAVSPYDQFGDPNIRYDIQNEGLGSVDDYTSSYKFDAL